MKVIFFMLAFMASVACAEDSLELNPLDLKWGYTLQDAKVLYPDGVTFPINIKDKPYIAYTFPGNQIVLWSGIPVDFVQLIFTTDNQLFSVELHFNYAHQATVKQQSLTSFGSGFKRKDEKEHYIASWISSQGGVARYLSVNSNPQFEWAYIVARKPTPEKNKK